MDSFDAGDTLTREEIAWQLAELFEELSTDDINELLSKNVPMESLRFFSEYADVFARTGEFTVDATRRLPNLLLLGYLLRVLEERLLGDTPTYDA